MPDRKPKKQKTSPRRQYTDKDHARGLEAVSRHGGDCKAAGKEVKIPASTLTGWVERYAERYQQIEIEARRRTLEYVVEARTSALTVLRETLQVKRQMLREPKQASLVRATDIARAFEILDRVMRLDQNTATERVHHSGGVSISIESRILQLRIERKVDPVAPGPNPVPAD